MSNDLYGQHVKEKIEAELIKLVEKQVDILKKENQALKQAARELLKSWDESPKQAATCLEASFYDNLEVLREKCNA